MEQEKIAKPAIRKTLVKVSGLSKSFKLKKRSIEILHTTEFKILDDNFTIIYGPSGSGKSTLLHVLAGLEPPTTGSVEMLGQNLYSLSSDERAQFRARNVGLVYQSNYWVKSLTVLENIALPLILSGHNRSSSLKTARTSLDQLGMGEFAHSEPLVLSGGEQQRVSVIRALVSNPKILMADEPTGNLDSKNGSAVMDLLLKAKSEIGCLIILVTHNLEYLSLSTQQVNVLDGSITVHEGPYELPNNLLNMVKREMVTMESKTPEEGSGDTK